MNFTLPPAPPLKFTGNVPVELAHMCEPLQQAVENLRSAHGELEQIVALVSSKWEDYLKADNGLRDILDRLNSAGGTLSGVYEQSTPHQPVLPPLQLLLSEPPLPDALRPTAGRNASFGHKSPKICRKSWKANVHKNLNLFFTAVQKGGTPRNGPFTTDELLNWLVDASTAGKWAPQEFIDRIKTDNKLRGTWATWLRSVLDPDFKLTGRRVPKSRCFKPYRLKDSALKFEDVPNPDYANKCLFVWVRTSDPGQQPYISKVEVAKGGGA